MLDATCLVYKTTIVNVCPIICAANQSKVIVY